MYMTPSRGGGGTPLSRKQIPEGPISAFTSLILETPTDQWQKRVASLRKLVDSIPEGSQYSTTTAWFNTPPLLRHLAIAIGDLLKDPRSTVVKRTCESLTRLFIKCQSDARYLLKDLMPVILSVHAQTVQVIRTAVQEMVMDSIPEVPCKMVMPLWMERLKVDKSRTVRDACALYLGQALRCWTADNYLSDEIWIQVGGTLLRSLRDPSPNVRSHAKSALEYVRRTQPVCWTRLVEDEDSPAAKDPKLLRWLQSLGQGGEAEELSVASKFSFNSDTRYARQPRMSPSSRRGLDDSDLSIEDTLNIPMSINVTSSSSATTRPMMSSSGYGMDSGKPRMGLGPPVRVSAPFQQIMESPPPSHVKTAPPSNPLSHHTMGGALSGTPPRHPTSTASPSDKHPKSSPSTTNYLQTIEDHSDHDGMELESASSFPSDLQQHSFGNDLDPSRAKLTKDNNGSSSSAAAYKAADTIPNATEREDDGPFIASMQELKKHAAQRRSRNSMLMKERFRMSTSIIDTSLDDDENAASTSFTAADGSSTHSRGRSPGGLPPSHHPPRPPNATSVAGVSGSNAPEHMVIAIRLLRAHKAHVDQIMETLKIEMDTLRDFDRLLDEPGRPLEEEVLDYFESVGLCLDQRTQAGQSLQREMDRISRGEPPQE